MIYDNVSPTLRLIGHAINYANIAKLHFIIMYGDRYVPEFDFGKDGFIDGMDGRGTQYAHKNPTKWTKTGSHFDIKKILEEMK
jgi:hypothetical protein